MVFFYLLDTLRVNLLLSFLVAFITSLLLITKFISFNKEPALLAFFYQITVVVSDIKNSKEDKVSENAEKKSKGNKE